MKISSEFFSMRHGWLHGTNATIEALAGIESAAVRVVSSTLIGGGGYIHIFVFYTTNFF